MSRLIWPRFFSRSIVALVALSLVSVSAAAFGQGVLINIHPTESVRLPRPIIVDRTPRSDSYKIKELTVEANLADQIARVQVSQTFVNTGRRQMEVCFVFPLPYDGAVDRLTLLVDGKEYDAKLLDAKEARRLYESIVRKNKDPALLEWVGRGMFKTSVFPVPPGAERKVTLRYSQLCRTNQGLTDFLFPLGTAKYTSHPVENLELRISIESSSDIKNVYSPSHAIDIKRPDDRRATITWTSKNSVPANDFRLFYDVGKGKVGARVVSYRPNENEDGYFLLLASPEINAADAQRPPKTVLFVVDRSGSMSGKKIEQARGALKFVLNNLREGDLFNIIAYDSEVTSFRPELQGYDEETRQAALGFVEGIYAGGSTNIDAALAAALAQIKDSSRPNFVIFLTDGLPTAGETGEAKIVVNTQKANALRARLFAFGVGYDVNSRLLDKLARANFGQSEYVRPNEDIEAAVSSLYGRIGTPVMTDLAIKVDVEGLQIDEGTAVNRTYPKEIYDLFAGEQLVWVGRYKKPGEAKVTVTGAVAGQPQSFDFPATLVEKSADETNAFVEKLWAMRRVGEIIDELDLKGRNEELVKELVTLATQHGILTPYTSFLADENNNFRDLASNQVSADLNLGSLRRVAGRSAFAQRQAKQYLQNAQNAASESGGGGGRGGFYFDVEDGREVRVETVQNVGRKTFFWRNNQWVDSSVTADEEKKPTKIERYSDEYFRLLSEHGKDAGQYLAIDKPVVVKLGGKVYAY